MTRAELLRHALSQTLRSAFERQPDVKKMQRDNQAAAMSLDQASRKKLSLYFQDLWTRGTRLSTGNRQQLADHGLDVIDSDQPRALELTRSIFMARAPEEVLVIKP